MLVRRIIYLVVMIIGLEGVLAACGSAQTSSQTISMPRSVCSLLSAKEARAALDVPTAHPDQCRVLAGDQSGALYDFGGSISGVLLVNMSWNKSAIHTFTVTHSGHARYAAGDTRPLYKRITVAGVPAYWRLNPPPVSGGFATAPVQSLSALKSGYVVTLESMSLSESQDERALGAIISRL